MKTYSRKPYKPDTKSNTLSSSDTKQSKSVWSLLWSLIEGLFTVIAVMFMTFIALLVASGGPAWGRPLRIRGRQLHPELREGSDWTRGLKPDPTGLDEATRQALEALWLHDAQKEHASVPAFSRIAWMLAAVGAPAELMEWEHRAALE